MKNNEIMISARFVIDPAHSEEYSFLVLKDITLKALIEAIYYGMEKLKEKEQKEQNTGTYGKVFALLEEYLKTRRQLQVCYSAKGEFRVINFTDTVDGVPIYDRTLDSLGFVTACCLLFTRSTKVEPRELFRKVESSYILKAGESLEYNISTRRLNVIESSVIEILPPGEMPERDKSSLLDVLIPTVLSTGGMLLARVLIMKLSPSAAGMGNTMLLMSAAMGLVALVTSFYNYFKNKKNFSQKVAEWKENYENYIHRMIATIKEWQVSDIKYLNSVYPDMGKLFNNTAEINGAIFSRSQNDNDFMTITLGNSEEVKPLFEIKSEKKDSISYEIYYKKKGDDIEIYPPIVSKKEQKRIAALSPDERAKEEKNRFLLTELPYVFANKGIDPDTKEELGFNYLRSDMAIKPPLLLDLKSSGALGVVSNDVTTSYNFIRHVIFELAYYHAPEDLQFVIFFPEEADTAKQEQLADNYKYLPHTNELLDGVSQIVFDQDSAGLAFGQLLSIMNERARSGAEDKEAEREPEKHTQIVCVVFHDYKLKESGFSKFLPEVPKEGEPYVNSNGLTFIFVTNHKDKLPKYCGNIVDIDKDNKDARRSSQRYNILSRETLNVLSAGEGSSADTAQSNAGKAKDTDKLIEYKNFKNEYIFEKAAENNEKFTLAFRQLSAIYYTRIAENGKVPSMVTLFELYGIDSAKLGDGSVGKEILSKWNITDYTKDRENDITNNLCVPIGLNERGQVSLDLYEKADGPHMLVAGTTGSGKSETIITYLIGLCAKFSPIDLNLMLVDMKGGGFSDRLGNLPHCVGVVTDTAGEEEGTSATYMLKRFLESLNAEIKHRKLLLSRMGVDNVDDYIRAVRTIRAIRELRRGTGNAERINKLITDLRNDKQRQELENDQSELEPLSHLVLVVDEFTELKRFSSESDDVDFITEITTIARVGRTLGFHIVLVSQNIEGAITDDIRVNSKARICLKVATKQASKEMIGTTAAAAPTMPLNGRAYLLVGTGSRFEYFQSAYTGASKNLNLDKPVNVTLVPSSGRYNSGFYSSKDDNRLEKARRESITDKKTQLVYMVETICKLGKNWEKPRQVFLPPLPSKIADETKWEGLN